MKKDGLRVLQLIDSLETGGAERVAVNFANGLAEKEVTSFLCTTRAEGPLKDFILPSVTYWSLEKKSSFDTKAILRLRSLTKNHKIQVIHAHSSSFFVAVLIKLMTGVKVVWHDHYGKSELLHERDAKFLKLFAKFFNHAFVVNTLLGNWSKEVLKIKEEKVEYLPNYPDFGNIQKSSLSLENSEGKNIVCLANLRPQKDHITLLKSFKEVLKKHPNTKLYLLGKDSKDSCSEEIHSFIEQSFEEGKVIVLGSRNDVPAILKQCDLGILTSISEGLPLAILEYGLAKLPMLCTKVGECPEVVINENLLIEVGSYKEIAHKINSYFDNTEMLEKDAQMVFDHIETNYSKNAAIDRLKNVYKSL